MRFSKQKSGKQLEHGVRFPVLSCPVRARPAVVPIWIGLPAARSRSIWQIAGSTLRLVDQAPN